MTIPNLQLRKLLAYGGGRPASLNLDAALRRAHIPRVHDEIDRRRSPLNQPGADAALPAPLLPSAKPQLGPPLLALPVGMAS